MKDITQFLQPDLVITLGDRVYTVSPPSRDNGLKMSAVVAVGVEVFSKATDQCMACGRSGAPEIPEATRELVQSMREDALGLLSLGADVVAQMTADGIPEAHQDTAALYALYYWTLGEETADQILSPAAKQAQEQAPKA